ncbi:hypothetical protein A3Q56_00804 [Intoshia linei]|uniref:Uncharacterized protein n=1 Tax=Intoshia linei TaxID=1819745 RepID=A0A177BD39_9BILA|nr:hypothetical protein A3Q56_00804 [Intoshia linei]
MESNKFNIVKAKNNLRITFNKGKMYNSKQFELSSKGVIPINTNHYQKSESYACLNEAAPRKKRKRNFSNDFITQSRVRPVYAVPEVITSTRQPGKSFFKDPQHQLKNRKLKKPMFKLFAAIGYIALIFAPAVILAIYYIYNWYPNILLLYSSNVMKTYTSNLFNTTKV